MGQVCFHRLDRVSADQRLAGLLVLLFSYAWANHLDDLGIGVELGFETLPATIVPVDELLLAEVSLKHCQVDNPHGGRRA